MILLRYQTLSLDKKEKYDTRHVLNNIFEQKIQMACILVYILCPYPCFILLLLNEITKNTPSCIDRAIFIINIYKALTLSAAQ